MRKVRIATEGASRRRRNIAAALSLGIAAGLLPALTSALGMPLRVDAAAETLSPSGTGRQGTNAEESAALAKARQSGARVEVMGKRTETSQVFANPNGTFTQDSYVVPQWVRQGGKLVRIDTTLHKNSDGSLSPKAAQIGVRFSGGGAGPLVTVVRDGRSMSWTWPKPLPAPVVAGDTVTYPGVLKDVDLKLQANSGGFGQLLVVKNARAAADPALKEITFGVKTSGLTVGADEHGNMSAKNPAGQTVFASPTPLMWDSTVAAPPPGAQRTGPPRTDEFEQPYGARNARMGLKAGGGKLSLTPDAEILKGKATRYPVYIDPFVSGAREAWTIAYKKYPDATFWNGAGWDGGSKLARIGYENETNGLARSFFRMDSNNLWNTNKVIKGSTFRIKNVWSWSCTDKKVEVWLTGAISSSTSWSKQPTWADQLDYKVESKGWSAANCPAGNLAFDVTAAAKKAVTNKWNNITLGMRANYLEEDDVFTWKKFDATTAVLSTEYNTVPNAPTQLDTVPSTDGCHVAPPYALVGNTDIYLTAKASDPDGGTVSAQFTLWPYDHYDSGAGVIFDQTVSVTSGTVARVKVPKTTLIPHLDVADGNFSWRVRISDGSLYSAWTPIAGCRFVFDPLRPSSPPGVASQQFPDGSGGWPAGTGSVRTEGTFAVSNGGVDDVVKYEYWTSWDSTHRTAAPASAGGSVEVKLTPTVAGPNRVYVRSHDRAGNVSDTLTYLFYANGPRVPDKPGDLNGDGKADIWGANSAGELRRFYGNGDGTVSPVADAASTDGWNGTKITHRGDWTGDGYEDLLALRRDTALNADRLWIHSNDGTGFACTSCTGVGKQELTVYDPANDHWKGGVRQILAIGDVDGPLDADGDGTVDAEGFPDLLVNTGTALWLYYGSPDYRLDSYRDPVLLAAGDNTGLDDVTLAAPGDFTGDGQVDMIVRFDTAGGLYVYDLINPDAPGYPGYVGADHRFPIGSGWQTSNAPLLTTAPDANGNGKPDIWVVGSTGTLRVVGDYDASTGSYHPAMSKVASTEFTGYTILG